MSSEEREKGRQIYSRLFEVVYAERWWNAGLGPVGGLRGEEWERDLLDQDSGSRERVEQHWSPYRGYHGDSCAPAISI